MVKVLPTSDTWAMGPPLSLCPGSPSGPLPDRPLQRRPSPHSSHSVCPHSCSLSLLAAQNTGCRKSGLGAGPRFARGGQVGGFLLLPTWPQTASPPRPPPLPYVAKMLLPPGEWTPGQPPLHLCPTRQREPPQDSEDPLILGCTMALGPQACQGHSRAKADRARRNPGRHICYVLRDQDPTGYPAGGLCAPQRRRAYLVTLPLHPSPGRSRVKSCLLQQPAPASAQVLWKTVP